MKWPRPFPKVCHVLIRELVWANCVSKLVGTNSVRELVGANCVRPFKVVVPVFRYLHICWS